MNDGSPFPPPDGEAVADETWAHPEPDEFGFGYYRIDDDETPRVESPAGHGTTKPAGAVRPTTPSPGPDTFQPGTFQPETYDADEYDTDVYDAGAAVADAGAAEAGSWETEPMGAPDPPHDTEEYTSPVRRYSSGPRNWRIPTLITVGVLVVGIAVLAIALPGTNHSAVAPTPTIELRDLPSKIWQSDIGQHRTGLAIDATSLYAVVRRNAGVQVVALELATGKQRWATTIDGAQDDGVGDLMVGPVGVLALFASPNDNTNVLRVLDAKSGAVQWQATADSNVAAFVSPTLLTSAAGATPATLQAIDVAHKKLSAPVGAEASYTVGATLYVDQEGFLTAVDPLTLQPLGTFSFRHIERLLAPLPTDHGAMLIGADSQVVRVSATGAREWSYDPRVGALQTVSQLSGGRLAVAGDLGVRVIATTVKEATNVTKITDTSGLAGVTTFDGDDVLFVYGVVASGVQTPTVTAMSVSGGALKELSHFQTRDARGVPRLEPIGAIVYAREQTRTGNTRDTAFAAYDITTGAQLWSLALADNQTAQVIDSGLLVSSSSSALETIAFYTNR